MESINPMILDNLTKYVDENPDIPNEMKNLIEELMIMENAYNGQKDGIEILYEKFFAKFVNNTTLIEWSKKYVE